MATGAIVKLVKTFGSRWGWISDDFDAHHLFFNTASLNGDDDAFDALIIGQAVRYDERSDQVTGSHALNLVSSSPGVAVMDPQE